LTTAHCAGSHDLTDTRGSFVKCSSRAGERPREQLLDLDAESRTTPSIHHLVHILPASVSPLTRATLPEQACQIKVHVSDGTMARVRAKSAHHCSCVSSITSIATSASRQASCAPRDSHLSGCFSLDYRISTRKNAHKFAALTSKPKPFSGLSSGVLYQRNHSLQGRQRPAWPTVS
jgi:hypothetical protein